MSDVVIVGAGIVGAACAMRLAEAGHAVTILERTRPAEGTTGAGMGHVVVLDGHPTQLELAAWSRRLWDALAPSMPADIGHHRCGTLWVATEAAQMDQAQAKHAALERHGVDATLLSAHALSQAEPHLAPGLAGGLHVEGDSVLSPPHAARWMLHRAERAGASLLENAEVRKIGHGRIERTDGSVISADHVIVAAGNHTASLLATRALDGAIWPRKGHLAITAPAHSPQLCRHQLVELAYDHSVQLDSTTTESIAFNLQPRRSGQLVIGSSRQTGSWNDQVEPGVLERMLQRARTMVPTLGSVPIERAWTGLRPATSDGLPLIGPLPDDPQTILAAGHEGLGLTTSVGTAALVECLIDARPPPMSIEPLAPYRSLAKGPPS